MSFNNLVSPISFSSMTPITQQAESSSSQSQHTQQVQQKKPSDSLLMNPRQGSSSGSSHLMERQGAGSRSNQAQELIMGLQQAFQNTRFSLSESEIEKIKTLPPEITHLLITHYLPLVDYGTVYIQRALDVLLHLDKESQNFLSKLSPNQVFKMVNNATVDFAHAQEILVHQIVEEKNLSLSLFSKQLNQATNIMMHSGQKEAIASHLRRMPSELRPAAIDLIKPWMKTSTRIAILNYCADAGDQDFIRRAKFSIGFGMTSKDIVL